MLTINKITNVCTCAHTRQTHTHIHRQHTCASTHTHTHTHKHTNRLTYLSMVVADCPPGLNLAGAKLSCIPGCYGYSTL